MSKIDQAREMIVEAISSLEDTIEELIPAQAPGSTQADLQRSLASLKSTTITLRDIIERVEFTLSSVDHDGC
jgi:hypothetical protein